MDDSNLKSKDHNNNKIAYNGGKINDNKQEGSCVNDKVNVFFLPSSQSHACPVHHHTHPAQEEHVPGT